MTRTTKTLIIISGLLFMLSFFLPSHLTSHSLEENIEFVKNNQVGYQVYIILFFPIAFYLFWKKHIKTSFYFSASFLILNNDLFEHVIDLFFNAVPFWINGLLRFVIPLLLITCIGIFFIKKSVKQSRHKWYLVFILFIIGFYFTVNDRSCMIEFVSDTGFKSYDLTLWFNNCGTNYAWWISPILFNIGLYNEIRRSKTVAKSPWI
jgi:hypothetical protein